MKYAPLPPEGPSTAELHETYMLDSGTLEGVEIARDGINHLLQDTRGMLAVLGPCALTADKEIVTAESEEASDLEITTLGTAVLRRMPMWKPRTNPTDWHGIETTDPVLAYELLAEQAATYADVMVEYDHMPHVERYGQLTTMAWFGGRNDRTTEKLAMAAAQPTLPLGVKHGLDGDISPALAEIAAIDSLPERRAYNTQSVLIYRGGENAQTPETWAERYKQAYEQTGGKLIVDTAHGSEMAHHLEGNFRKSVAGQVACMEHVIALADEGYVPKGIMIETSDAASPTDPLMPFHIALKGVTRLAEITTSARLGRSKV